MVAYGTNSDVVIALKKATLKLGADFKIVAPKIGGTTTTNGRRIEADFQLAGGSSVLFDAVFIAVSKDGAKVLSKEASAIAWIHDAFAHLKVIGSTPEAKTLLDAAGVLPDQGVKIDSGPDAFLNTVSAGRIWEREPSVRAIF